MTWKGANDGRVRQYDYSYDAANRLMAADFKQYTNGAFDQSAGMNFNVKMGDGSNPTSAYDLNCNIRRMQQWGLKNGISQQIDDLNYHYHWYDGSNKLYSVEDGISGNTGLGDFTNTNGTAQDYDYDMNGNMTVDGNKGIGSIVYNHLNLKSCSSS